MSQNEFTDAPILVGVDGERYKDRLDELGKIGVFQIFRWPGILRTRVL